MAVKKLYYILIIFILIAAQGFLKGLNPKPKVIISKEQSALNFNESFLKFSHLGHGRLLGALTWVATLLEGDIEHYKDDSSNSWMFHRFKSISIYDPRFYENYLYGGQYLSIIKDDISGATAIYDKGISFYPEDFWLNYHAGFHYYFEAHNRKKALASYNVLSKNKKALELYPSLPTLLAKLRAEDGDLEAAYSGLYETYQNLPENSRFRLKFHNTLYSIRAKIDLECLNSSKKESCNRADFDGNPYQKRKGSYVSNRSLVPILLRKKKSN